MPPSGVLRKKLPAFRVRNPAGAGCQKAGMSKKRLIIIVLSFCAILGLVFGVLYLNSQMEKPLGPSLRGDFGDLSAQAISNSDQLPTPAQVSTQN